MNPLAGEQQRTRQRTAVAWLPRSVRALLAALLFATSLVAVVQVTTAAPASASTPAMTRTEILDRARYWVNRQVTYDTNASAPDSSGVNYRRDCSGLVGMAWRLGWSPGTGSFIGNHADWITISKSQLQPGDAMLWHNSGTDGHMEMFVRWKNPNNQSEGAYVYSFNSHGEKVKQPNGSGSLLGFNSNAEMNTYTKFIRRSNIVGESYSGGSVCLYTALSGAKIYNGPGYGFRGEPVSQGSQRYAHVNTFLNTWTANPSGTSLITTTWRKVSTNSDWLRVSEWSLAGCTG